MKNQPVNQSLNQARNDSTVTNQTTKLLSTRRCHVQWRSLCPWASFSSASTEIISRISSYQPRGRSSLLFYAIHMDKNNTEQISGECTKVQTYFDFLRQVHVIFPIMAGLQSYSFSNDGKLSHFQGQTKPTWKYGIYETFWSFWKGMRTACSVW